MTTVASEAGSEARSIAAAVRAAPTVARLSGGPFGGAGTYLPGHRVTGVEIGAETVEVHVVGRYGHTVGEIADEVRDAVSQISGGRRVDVVIEDLA